MAIIERIRRCDGIKTFMIDYRDPTGRRRRETAGTTRTQAKDLLARRIGEVKSGTYVHPRDKKAPPAGPTFGEFADRFLRDYASQRRSGYYG